MLRPDKKIKKLGFHFVYFTEYESKLDSDWHKWKKSIEGRRIRAYLLENGADIKHPLEEATAHIERINAMYKQSVEEKSPEMNISLETQLITQINQHRSKISSEEDLEYEFLQKQAKIHKRFLQSSIVNQIYMLGYYLDQSICSTHKNNEANILAKRVFSELVLIKFCSNSKTLNEIQQSYYRAKLFPAGSEDYRNYIFLVNVKINFLDKTSLIRFISYTLQDTHSTSEMKNTSEQILMMLTETSTLCDKESTARRQIELDEHKKVLDIVLMLLDSKVENSYARNVVSFSGLLPLVPGSPQLLSMKSMDLIEVAHRDTPPAPDIETPLINKI